MPRALRRPRPMRTLDGARRKLPAGTGLGRFTIAEPMSPLHTAHRRSTDLRAPVLNRAVPRGSARLVANTQPHHRLHAARAIS